MATTRLRWSAIALSMVLASFAACSAAAQTEPPDPDTLIATAQQEFANSAQSRSAVSQLQAIEPSLSPRQRWQLQLLEAREYTTQGNYADAIPLLNDVIEHSDEASLRDSASARLVNIYSITHQYEKAYALVNTLTAELGTITDARIRVAILSESAQMLDWVGQHDEALEYAQRLAKEGTDTARCLAYTYQIGALLNSHRLDASDPLFNEAIALCLAQNQTVYANTIRLNQASQFIEEGRTAQAIQLLLRIEPSIRASDYQPHKAWLQAYLASAYLQKGDTTQARRYARKALEVTHHAEFTALQLNVYKTLYSIEKKENNDAAALAYHEKYMAQYKADMDDAKARALAYQMVKQEVQSKRMRLDTLSKQNRILQLRHALDAKQTETTRLYVLILLIVLACIAFWLYKIKHSQIRFRRMAREDSLTGAFNREHFFERCTQTLQRLHKTHTDACLLILDMDHFKRVNDTYGHVAGDVVLKHVAEVCRRELRASDLFGRIGGEEFGILMPGCLPEQGIEIGNRICTALAANPTHLDHGQVTVTASIGLASIEGSGYVLRKLMIDADTALYAAKRSGRNRVSMDTSEIMGTAI